MRKLSNALKLVCIVALLSPLAIAWLDRGSVPLDALGFRLPQVFARDLFASFKQLSITLGATLAFAGLFTVVLGYLSVLSMRFGRLAASALNAIESVPAILIALFCYAPVSGFMAKHTSAASAFASLLVFIGAATITTLPEAVRSIAIPLGDLYNRKYSMSFRSYGFTKSRILTVLMNTHGMRGALKRSAAGILLKTLVLDCSFGFIIQLGFGSYGTPAHSSPGALIAANRDALFTDGNPVLFWMPSLLLVSISTAFLLMLSEDKEKESMA